MTRLPDRDDIRKMGIQALGPLTLDDQATLGRRDRVVLETLMVSRPAAASTDRLAEVLWPDGPPVSATKVVQGSVARLRGLLGSDAIVTSDQGYRLNGVEEIDVVRFEEGVARGRAFLALGQHDRAAHTLAQALGLWRGDPYPDVCHWDSAAIEVVRLTELRLQAEELRTEALLGRGDHDAALVASKSLVAAQPLRERRWLQLALAEYRSGHTADALATLRRGGRHLRTELGLDLGVDADDLERAMLRQDPSLLCSEPPRAASTDCPWPGLSSYDQADADCYFGREAEVVSALAILRSRPVLVVAGPSGVGKSSFVRAGLGAALAAEGRSVLVTTPATGSGCPASVDVLVVDQAEELFQLAPTAIEAYVDGLVAQTTDGLLVIALRADRMADVARHPELARLVEHGLFLLGGVGEDGLRRAIETPATLNGLRVEPGLVDLLLRDLEDEPGALPLLSHALVQTWERREGATLTVDGYRATGGIRGAVAQSAEALYGRLTPDQQGALRLLMLRLVSSGPEGEPLRARVPRALVLGGATQDALVERLVGSRLVTSDEGMLTLAHEALARAWPRLRDWLDDDIEGRRTLQHLTASAAAWDALGRPPSELYRGVRLHRAQEWRDRNTVGLSPVETSFLDAGRRLADEEERSAEESARRQLRANRRLRVLVGGLAAALVAAAAAAGVAVRQSGRADTSSLAADARSLGAKSLASDDPARALLLAVAGARLDESPDTRANLGEVLGRRPGLVEIQHLPAGMATSHLVVDESGRHTYVTDQTHHLVQLAVPADGPVSEYQAGGTDGDVWPVPVDIAGRLVAVAASPLNALPIRLLDPDDLTESDEQLTGWPRRRVSVSSLDLSADGRWLAAAVATSHVESDTNGWIDGGQTIVWDLSSPGRPVVGRIPTPANFYNGVTLSDDGRTVFVTNPLTAYDVGSGRRLWTRPRSDFSVAIALAPDGGLLAVPDADEPSDVALVDAQTGDIVERLRGHTAPLTALRFSGDGSWIAASANDATALVWDVDTGAIAHRVDVGIEQVSDLAFQDTSTLLTVTRAPAQVQTWDLSGRRSFVARLGGEDAVSVGRGMIRVDHSGTRIASMSNDADDPALNIYDTGTGRSRRIRGTLGPEWGGAGSWSPDDTAYAVGYGAGVVQVLDPGTGRELARRTVIDESITEVAHSADGRHLVAAGDDGTVVLLDAGDLSQVGVGVRVPEKIYGATASPDGRMAFVAAGGEEWRPFWDVPIRHWYLVDLKAGRIVRDGDIAVDNAIYTSFSPDGRRVAVSGRDGQVAIIDVTTGRPVGPPVVGHDGDVYWIAYSDDGSQVTSGSTAGDVALWDGRTGDLLATAVVGGTDGLAVSGFREDGQILVASQSGWVGLWDPSLEHAVRFACTVAGRDLTSAEWADLLPGRDWRPTCAQ